MFWKGKKLRTIGEVLNEGIIKVETKEDANSFMDSYSSSCGSKETAEANVRYISGYLDLKEQKRVIDLFLN